MDNIPLWTWLASMLVAGLAGSLHCIGMCGPILLGFSQVFGATAVTVGGVDPAAANNRWKNVFEFACYHGGRVWTYMVLGFASGYLGGGLRRGGDWLSWQKPVTVAIGCAVVLSGLVLWGVVPGLKIDALASGCAVKRWRGLAWFESLVRSQGLWARFVLGMVMGLLPCGLVYAMLVAVAAMPSPLYSALGMLAFGIGTCPSLTGVLLASGLIPHRLRIHGTRLAAAVVVVMGSYMVVRSAMSEPKTGKCPACEMREQGLDVHNP